MLTSNEKIILTAKIDGIACSACINRITNKLKKIPFVYDVSINLIDSKALITVDKNLQDLNSIQKEIENIGYKISFTNIDLQLSKNFFDLKLTIQIIFGLIIIIVEMFNFIPLIHNFLQIFPFSKNLLLFVLTSIVLYVGGLNYYKRSLKNLTSLTFDMSSLISLGTLSAYAYSSYLTFKEFFFNEISHHTFFDSAATIIILINIGKKLEDRTKLKTIANLNHLKQIVPQYSTISLNGKESKIKSEEIKKDDIVILKPGDISPVDGIIIDGFASFNESFLTGESLPVEKKAGDYVYCGTINLNGLIKIKTEKNPSSSLISKIIDIAEKSSLTKVPVQRLADKISSFFVPLIIAIAFISFSYHFFIDKNLNLAILSLISTLVVSCPCAFGLAAPAAIVAGIGKASKNFIFFKNPEAIENLSKINMIFFDKTGSLTEGKPQVVKVIYNQKFNSKEIENIALSAAVYTRHPLSIAIANYYNNAKTYPLKFDSFEYFPSKGGKLKLKDKTYFFGSKNFLIENNVDNFFDIENFVEASKVFLSEDKELLAIFCVYDELKEKAIETIRNFQKDGVEVVILSGDDKESVKKIADKLNISSYFGKLNPLEKTAIINESKQNGKIVAMVGDGINDAAALASADVGVSFSNASEFAANCADIVIMNSSLESVYLAFDFSRKTIRAIKQNFFWAFVYNLALIPIAAAGLLHPIYAAAAMSFSSLSVLLNSLRIAKK